MTRLNYLLIAIILIALTPISAISQSLSVNTDGSAAEASAMLDVKSTTKGLLVPRMSRAERDAIASPATGLLIFQNAPDSIGYYYYNGTAWTWLLSNSNADSLAWKTGGNTGTLPANNFIGTRDNADLVIKTNNAEVMRIATNGAIGLGTNAPSTGIGGGAKIDIRDEDGNFSDISQMVAGTTGAPFHNFIKQRGTVAAPAATVSGDALGQINGLLYDGSTYRYSTVIRMQADGTISTTRTPAAIRFFTTDTNAVSPVERLTIKSYGSVGIGVSTPVARLDVAGNGGGTNSVLLRSGNTSVGTASNQLTFGYNGTAQYRHSIKTRHNSASRIGNAYDFYLWNQGVDNIDTLGSEAAMTLDGNHRGMLGIGTQTPRSEVHISDGSTSLKNVTDGGGYGASMLITDNNIPRIYLEAAGQPADQKLMDIRLFNQSIRFAALTDAGNAFTNSDILVINRGGNVGIGVPTPAVALDVNGSATIGTGNTNTGTKTIASGNANNLSGNYSIVTGESNTVSSIRSMVSGVTNNVSGENNIVSGVLNQVVSPYGHSIVVGYQDTLNGSASAIFGFKNNVTGFTGFAAGDRNTVFAQNGTAFGYQNATSGTSAFVTGLLDTAAGNNSAAFGLSNKAASFNEFALGMYGTNYTPVSTSVYDAADRIFNVGNGISSVLRADAFTILKGGNVGIGTANPTALLDINGNTIRVRTAKTPASSADAGNTGDIAWDNDYIYICVATNTWKRVAISTW
ncbi:MAG: hypothetical protein JNM14_00325 [Ferruginibacter sp.]|nr:hypothetical protein [Ferruginibacter sp.]